MKARNDANQEQFDQMHGVNSLKNGLLQESLQDSATKSFKFCAIFNKLCGSLYQPKHPKSTQKLTFCNRVTI